MKIISTKIEWYRDLQARYCWFCFLTDYCRLLVSYNAGFFFILVGSSGRDFPLARCDVTFIFIFLFFIFYYYYYLFILFSTQVVEYLFRRPTFICLHSLLLLFYADQLVIIRLVSVWKGDKFCFYVVLKVYFI